MGSRSEITSFHVNILYHIIRCNSEFETVSHISKAIDALQPAVFRATKALIQRGYLQKLGGPSKGKKREIILTDKTLALFILAKRMNYKELTHYLRKTKGGRNAIQNREFFRLFDAIILLSEISEYEFVHEFVHLRSAVDYMLDHKWFEYEQTKVIDHEEIKDLQYTTLTYRISKPHVTEFLIIIGLFDRFGINIKPYVKTVLVDTSLRTSLKGYQEYTQELIDELIRKEKIVPELDRTRHNAIVKDIRGIIDDVETDKKRLESA